MRLPDFPRLTDYVDHYAELTPTRVAMTDGPDALTYSELRTRMYELAGAFVASAVGRGDRVAVYAHSSMDCACLLLAAASVGAIYVGLNPKHQAAELAVILEDADPALIVMLEDSEHDAHKIQAAQAAADRDGVVVVRQGAPRAGWRSWDEWIQQRDAPTPRSSEVSTLDPVAMVHTSGSSGRPKGALLLNRGLTRSYVIQAEHWYSGPPSLVSDLPVNHLGWVGDHCCAVLVAGGTLHFCGRYSAEKTLELIETHGATYWFTITTMLVLAMRSPRWLTADLGSLKRIVWAGAAAPRWMIDELAGRGITLSTCYGMTETCGNVTYADGDERAALYETIGRPDPRIETRVARPDGRECDIGETGEILVRDDVVFGGYFRRPEATAEAVDPDGWLHTGDLAKRRADGLIELAGRRNDMFKSGGYNVYPREIELALEGHPAVAQAVVVSVDDDVWGEVGYAFVRPVDGVEVASTELRTWARERLANYKVPKTIELRDDLPLLGIGKVDKHALRRAAQGASTGTAA